MARRVQVTGACLAGARHTQLLTTLDRGHIWPLEHSETDMGPVATLLLRNPLSGEDLTELRAWIASLSHTVEGNCFWIADMRPIGGDYVGEGRPFCISFEALTVSEENRDYSDEELDVIEQAIGYRPAASVGFIAYADDAVDHRVLGELCLKVAEDRDGIIDFGGELPEAAAVREDLYSIPYRSAGPNSTGYHVGTAAFLCWWLSADEFRMVK